MRIAFGIGRVPEKDRFKIFQKKSCGFSVLD